MLDDVEFKPYMQDRLIHYNDLGYYVIVPKDATRPVPLSCPVCDFLLRTQDDEISWHKFNCCDRCALVWAIPKKDQWELGWRPSIDELQKEICNRSPINVDIVIDL